jgi:hypothetical protein
MWRLLNIFKALQALYLVSAPVAKKPPGYWKDKENQKKFFDQLAIKRNIQTMDDWNQVTTDVVVKEGGSFIDYYYNGSLQQGIYRVHRSVMHQIVPPKGTSPLPQSDTAVSLCGRGEVPLGGTI